MKYNIRYVHKISPRDTDVATVDLPNNAFADRKTLAAALRNVGVLMTGGRLRSFRVEGAKVVCFPTASIWHSIIITASTHDQTQAPG